MNLIFMGPPGCGKGTQNKFFEDRDGLRPISTGDMFRELMQKETPLAKRARDLINDGKLVTDEVTIQMVREKLSTFSKNDGFILDGFPRTVPQAEALQKILDELDLNLERVIFIDVATEEVVRRLSGRRTCRHCKSVYHVSDIGDDMQCRSCGNELYQREDDNETTIRKRLATYDNQTLPLKKFYESQHLLDTVDGLGSPEDIYKSIKSKFKG